MKKLILLILFIPFVFAGNVDYGTVTLTVVNQPPEITNISIYPLNAFFDSDLNCSVKYKDENKKSVNISYLWIVNGIVKNNQKNTLNNFNESDLVECFATPTDDNGIEGISKSMQIEIQKTPLRAKLFNPMFRSLGLNSQTSEIMQSTSMSAITGMVTGKGSSNLTLLFTLVIFTFILISFNLFALFVRLKKKVLS